MSENSVERSDIVDFGAHFFPGESPQDPEAHEYIATQQGGPIYSDMDALLARYDDAGIDGVTLSQEHVIGAGDIQRVRRENDAMLDAAGDRDDVYTLAAVPTAAGGEVAAEEVQRCLDAGHNGAAISTRSDGIELHHDAVDPVLEVADRRDAPLFVHPKVHDSLHPDALNEADWRLNSLFGREIAVCESIVKTVNSGVFDRYDDLTLVFHHLGGNLASMLGRVRGDTDQDRWPDTNRLKPYPEFHEQLTSRVCVDTAGFYGDPAAFRATFETFPASNVLFGTDFPYETRTPAEFDAIVSTIRECTDADEIDDVLGGNARDLLVNT
jgi:predicted TIM-barrel fold metal-dependent hydrolase